MLAHEPSRSQLYSVVPGMSVWFELARGTEVYGDYDILLRDVISRKLSMERRLINLPAQ